ncbi:VOC family protein [Halorarum halophilum]|uniref:VOC family protein n=1 Tax=Halorarum halophilum TaxID=2743090 RepID=A0A7D5KWI2_9EURY|nr:VOC family protein [Halobaculum halophilum]QLG26678.1 VOC family protein [Halobaculum halophilum]
MTPTEFYHVAIKADDVAATAEFYERQFGAEVFDRGIPDEGEDGDENAVEYAALEIADKRLYVFDRPPYEASGLVEDLPTGLLHFGFVVEDVDAARADLGEAGVEFVMEPTDFGDLRIAFLLDPTGTLVELIEHLE